MYLTDSDTFPTPSVQTLANMPYLFSGYIGCFFLLIPNTDTRLEVLTRVKMPTVVLGFVTPCELACHYQHFEGTYCPHLQPRRPPWTTDIDVSASY
jgi:hypothetical protein